MEGNTAHLMDEFCGSKFWDSNETWYTTDPDFTKCFEETVLVWIPCAFYWLFSLFDFYYLKASLDRDIPWNKYNSCKLVLNLALLGLTAVDFVMALKTRGDGSDDIFPVDIWGPIIKFATFLLLFIFLLLNRKYGVQTSGCQFLFLFLLVVFSIPRCRTEVSEERERRKVIESTQVDYEYEWAHYKYVSFMIYFAISCAMLLLNCWADAMPRKTKYNRTEKEMPECSASFLSRVTYQWFDKMAWKGYRNPLEEKDLWDLRPQDSCKEIMPIFAKNWNKNVRKQNKNQSQGSFMPQSPNAQYSNGKVSFENPQYVAGAGSKKKDTSIMPPIIKSFGGVFLFGALMKLITDLLTFVQPQVLRLIIGFVEDSADDEKARQPEWKGIFYAVLLFIVAAAQTFILGQYFHRMFIVGLRIRTALINAIYRKALVISNATRKESTVGEIVNLMAVDAQRFMDLTTYLNMIWSAPLQISLALYFLWQLLGPSVLAGLAVMIILIPLNGVIANRIKVYQIRQMKYKDERVKLMNEVLSGIKINWQIGVEYHLPKSSYSDFIKYSDGLEEFFVESVKNIMIGGPTIFPALNGDAFSTQFSFIDGLAKYQPISERSIYSLCTYMFQVLKLYAWEPSFENQVLQIREKEIATLKSTAYLNASTSFLWSCAPFLVSVVTFAMYVLVNDENHLTAEKVFVGLTLFDTLKLPLATLPMLAVDIVEFRNHRWELDWIYFFATFSKIYWLLGAHQYPVSLVTFATYVLIDDNNVLDATKTFVSLSLFNILRFPLTMLPMLITNMVQTQVSVKRINKFMNSEELDPDSVQHDPKEPDPMIIENGSFSWGEDDTTLRNINMNVKKNTLCAVVGTVGSGKSSVIQAFLGEMDKKAGRVNTVGTVAYVPQQAWIQNATLRDNILFGKPYDRKRYNQVIDACALRADIDILSAGDQTEIGEKGINLSGGQKQRISLARAVYSNTDLYLLDDPLSAVDSHVGKHIFDEVIGPKGMLAKKTRVLVTHGITFLPKTDNIYVMKNGEISENGTYNELLAQKGSFADFLIQHLQDGGEEVEELDQIKQQLEGSIQSSELLGTLERAISLARSESLADSVSVTSMESGKNSLRHRKVGRQDSQASIISNTSLQKKEKQFDDGKLIETEKSKTGGVQFAVYKHYIKSVGIFLSVATLVLNFVFQAFQIGSNLWLTKWSNDKRVENDTGLRDMYLGVYGAFGFGQVISRYISGLCLALGCLNCAMEVFVKMLRKVLQWPMELFDTTPTGRIISRFSKDIDVCDSTLPAVVQQFLSTCFSVLATIVVISITTPIFLAVIVPIAFLYYFAQRFYVATSRQLMRLESVSRSPIYSHFGETVTGVSTIRAYAVQERFIDESDAKVDKNQVCKYPSLIANRWLAIRLEMVGNLIILFASLFAVLGGQTNPGLVGLSVSYALQVTQTLNWLVRMTSDIETNIVAVERIKEYGETKQEAPWVLENSKVPREWPNEGRVVFENFKVRYREGLDLVLKGVSFKIAGGEKIGIVGRTGAGKSSLTLSLFRIIESSGGRILIDDIDISTLGLHTLRSRLTIIPQDPILFSGSLRINLDPFETKSDDEIWKSLELSHLKAFVKSLPAGLNHEISEGGENLSVGQRQLVCLARALLRKTKVLVLDEATAAVDLETDDLIQKTIRSEFKDCTVLTIAHRLNTIMDSDKVIVLDKGEITEFASPTELLDNPNSAFYSMAKDANLV